MHTQASAEMDDNVVRMPREARLDDHAREFLCLVLEGNPQAWDHLVRTYSPMLERLASLYRIGDERHDAVQATFLRLFESGHSIRDPQALSGWLRTTLTNECLRVLRRKSRERRRGGGLTGVEDMPLAPDQRPDNRAVRHDELALLRQALSCLSARDRQLICLLSDQGTRGYRNISEQLGIPMGSIGPTRGRILMRLRHTLQAAGLDDCA